MTYNYYPQPYLNPYQPTVYTPKQSDIIWVSSEAEAIAYPIAPNNAVRLWHSSQPVVYFKSADASGRPSLKSYDLVERTESASAGSDDSATKDSSYAAKTDLDALSQSLDALKGEVKALRKELKKLKEVDNDDE